MPFNSRFKPERTSALLISALLITQLSACGTLMYPDRDGQTGDRLDSKVVLLDAVGLLFFVVPGFIAFVTDFSTGAIYLPGGAFAQLTDEELKQVSVDGKVDEEKLKQLIEQKTRVDLGEAPLTGKVNAEPLYSHYDIAPRLAQFQRSFAAPFISPLANSISTPGLLAVAGGAAEE